MLVPIAFGVGAALTAAVGVNVGADQYGRARRIAWAGAGVTLALTGLMGVCLALVPSLWLDLFTADPKAYEFGDRYLTIAAPFYGLFGAGQALYFASQGTGRMVLPVTVTIIRFLTVTAIGALAISLAWNITALFVAVAVGLTIMGAGQALCVLGPGWRAARSH
jgi:Na+-driven multidrug efflux pump